MCLPSCNLVSRANMAIACHPTPRGGPQPDAKCLLTCPGAPTTGVISMSLGGLGSAESWVCSAIQAAVDRGIIVVVAAGAPPRGSWPAS